MFNSLLRNIPMTFLAISLLINGILLFTSSHYRGKLEGLENDLSTTQASLQDCQKANEGWEHSYDTLLEACKVQSEVIVELGKDLHKERQESGDVVREILLMPSNEEEIEEPSINGETYEIQIPYAPPVAGLDDRLPDSLYKALQRSYSGSGTSGTPNP